MKQYTNNHGVSLPVAVWLAHDLYDHDDRSNYISVTTLIKSVRQIVLGSRVKANDAPPDIMNVFKAQLGTAAHTAIEVAWTTNYASSMRSLGYPEKVIDRIRINPVNPEPGVLAVYMEQRVEKEFDGVIVGGKFDMVIDGKLHDVKSASVWSFINDSSIGKWKLQGSIYRLLNQDKITDDHLHVQYLFTDWSRAAVSSTAGYPATPVLEHPVRLLSVDETDRYVRSKLRELKKYWEVPEIQLPLCTDEDLWRDLPKYKYYADPDKTARSTKNFDSLSEANMFMQEKGKGIVKTIPGEAKACNYCSAYNLCSQKDTFTRG